MIMLSAYGFKEEATEEAIRTITGLTQSELQNKLNALDGKLEIGDCLFYLGGKTMKYKYSIEGVEGKEFTFSGAMKHFGIYKDNEKFFTYYRILQNYGEAIIKDILVKRIG